MTEVIESRSAGGDRQQLARQRVTQANAEGVKRSFVSAASFAGCGGGAGSGAAAVATSVNRLERWRLQVCSIHGECVGSGVADACLLSRGVRRLGGSRST
jgi:hypothetical protein